MKTENSRCLILNADYTPITIVDWKRAMVWSFKYSYNKNTGIEIVDFYKNDSITGTNGKKFPIPAVAKTARYFKLHNHKVNFSRKNLFIRDNYTCQYCGTKKDLSGLTYDHVIPKSLWQYDHGSPTSWTNIVTACVDCNRKKRNRTPKQANMPLKNMPIIPDKSPKYLPITHYLLKIRSDIPQEWSVYLPESYNV
jgi:5-methylcytosine-specific restriction endonuclease McrA